MPRQRLPEYWSAETEIEIQNMALSLHYDEIREGNKLVRVFRAPSWLNDSQITLDAASKLRGWFREQVKTLKPSAADAISYGLKTANIAVSPVPTTALVGDENFPDKERYTLPDGINQWPIREVVFVKDGRGNRSVHAFHYTVKEPVRARISLFCFARTLSPKSAEELMRTLGPHTGLGDRHTRGYGHFETKTFQVSQQGQINL